MYKSMTWQWTLGRKMALIGLAGLIGLLALGGIGYWASVYLAQAADDSRQSEIGARLLLKESSDRALQNERRARMLAEFNQDLIALMQVAVEGPARREKGIAAEDILSQARDLALKAEMIREVPGADRPVPGTPFTLADQIIGNFEDVAIFFEYELPEIYATEAGTADFIGKQGAMIVSLTQMYWFISKTLGELANDLNTQVRLAQGEFAQASAEASRMSEAARRDMTEASRQANRNLILTFLGTVVILGLLFAWFRHNLVTPLRKTMLMAEHLQKGRVDFRLQLGHRSDEFRDMARALNDFADNLQHEVVQALKAMAHGDLNVEIHPVDDQDEVRGNLQKVINDLTHLLGQIQASGEQIASGSTQISDSSQALSQGATEQASSMEQITASMTQMGSQIRQNAENAGKARDLSGEAQAAAQKGNAQMQQMMSAMGEINEAGQNISKIIKTIDEIAFQTNLLALNAAVEAARAGQHGKGFAVVAEEVRNLAARSAKAARETADLIEGSVKKAENGARIADLTAGSLGEIVGGITQVSDLVAEIATASNEQAQGISQVSQGLGQIDQVTQQNTAAAEQSAAAAEELSSQAGQLRQMLGSFKLRQGSAPRVSSAPAPRVSSAPAPPVLSSVAVHVPKAVKGTPEVLIAWDDSLSVNIQLIDRQHRKLVDLINELFAALRAGRGNEKLESILDSLVSYTCQHFTEEERMMEAHGYPALSEHRAAHRQLVERVTEFQQKMQQGQATFSSDLFNFLKSWLLHHIKEEDRAYGPFLNGKGVL